MFFILFRMTPAKLTIGIKAFILKTKYGGCMKKRWALKIAAVLGAALLVCACSSSGSVPSGSPASDPVSSERIPDIVTSSQYSAQNIWGSGWNLGNTLDAKSDGSKENLGLKTETSWGMPMTSQEMINAVAAKGFKTIRIPVSWHNHITEESGHKIDPEWLARVKTIVDWSLAAGMKVIGINRNLAIPQDFTGCLLTVSDLSELC